MVTVLSFVVSILAPSIVPDRIGVDKRLGFKV